MAAINFPDSPSNGDTHVVDGVTYTYNSAETKWKTTINSNAFLPLTGGTLSGNLNMGTNDLTVGDVTASGTASLSGLTYPTSDGTTGQYLQTNGSGGLSWQTVDSVSVARITDSQTSGTAAGTFTSGAWRTRVLNTIEDDPNSIVTLASNQFTLGAGTYLIQWSAPALVVQRHQTQLYDVTGAVSQALGTSEYADPTGGVQNRSHGFDIVTLTANNTFEIQHQCSATRNTNGLGTAATLGVDEKYAMVIIFKLS
jgi:hypothetical protein